MENEPKVFPDKVERESLKPPTLAENFRDNFSYRITSYFLLPVWCGVVLPPLGLDAEVLIKVEQIGLAAVMIASEGWAFTHWIRQKLNR